MSKSVSRKKVFLTALIVFSLVFAAQCCISAAAVPSAKSDRSAMVVGYAVSVKASDIRAEQGQAAKITGYAVSVKASDIRPTEQGAGGKTDRYLPYAIGLIAILAGTLLVHKAAKQKEEKRAEKDLETLKKAMDAC